SISLTHSPTHIAYGSGGERVALAVGGASGSRLNRFHRPSISLTHSPTSFFLNLPCGEPDSWA
ncbi:MAG: hypothetical protein RRY13_08575, partial [Akkermansia sp.]